MVYCWMIPVILFECYCRHGTTPAALQGESTLVKPEKTRRAGSLYGVGDWPLFFLTTTSLDRVIASDTKGSKSCEYIRSDKTVVPKSNVHMQMHAWPFISGWFKRVGVSNFACHQISCNPIKSWKVKFIRRVEWHTHSKSKLLKLAGDLPIALWNKTERFV